MTMKLIGILVAAFGIPALVGPSILVPATDNAAIGRVPRQDIREVSVKGFGAAGDGVTNDTAAIQKAVDSVGAAGGGTIYFPRGIYLVGNGNPGARSWDNHVAIWVKYSNVHLRGYGVGATTIRLADGANAHIIKFGKREEGSLIINGGSVQSMKLDGNRANQTAPSERANHWHGIDVASRAQGIRLSDLYIANTQYYGIGMQRQGIKNSIIQGVVIENVGADGIDWKNDDGMGRGNVVRKVTVRNFGLASAALSLPQAGVDLRSGVYAENLTISNMSASDDLVGVRVLPDNAETPRKVPSQPTRVRAITVVGSKGARSVGVRIAASDVQASDVRARNLSDGIRVTKPGVRLFRVDVEANSGAGVRLTSDSLPDIEADRVYIDGIISQGNTDGIVYDSVDDVTVAGAELRNNRRIGHDIEGGSSNIRILGGSVRGNGTNVRNRGIGTIMRNISGAKTPLLTPAT
jgi:hypothetical protein